MSSENLKPEEAQADTESLKASLQELVLQFGSRATYETLQEIMGLPAPRGTVRLPRGLIQPTPAQEAWKDLPADFEPDGNDEPLRVERPFDRSKDFSLRRRGGMLPDDDDHYFVPSVHRSGRRR